MRDHTLYVASAAGSTSLYSPFTHTNECPGAPLHAEPELSAVTRAVRAAVLGTGLCLASSAAHAAGIIVTSNTDDGTMCTLREAIASINVGANSSGCSSSNGEPFGSDDTITFANPGEITLSLGQLNLNKSVSINASTVSGVTIDANQNSRVIRLADETAVTLTDLTLTGGSTSGDGGAIRGGEGGELTLVNSTITGNESGGYGGGLYVAGYGSSVNIVNSEFSNNIADQDGGAIYLYSDGGNTLTLTNSRVINNVALNDEGGGIWSDGYSDVITLTDSVVANNTAADQGGGIFLDTGTLTLINTRISGNSSTSSKGGGIYGDTNSTISILNSSVTGNSSAQEGGGIYAGSGTLTLTNSTVSGNSAAQEGGGVYTSGNTTLSHTTVANNANGTGYLGAGIHSSDELTLINSILADSIGGEDCISNGVLTADAQSIIEDGTCGSRFGDPGLLPLANNGGRTLTHALASDSIAINSGDNSTCLARDQRGFARNDRSCDVGAFEAQDDGGFFVIPTKNGKVVVIPE